MNVECQPQKSCGRVYIVCGGPCLRGCVSWPVPLQVMFEQSMPEGAVESLGRASGTLGRSDRLVPSEMAPDKTYIIGRRWPCFPLFPKDLFTLLSYIHPRPPTTHWFNDLTTEQPLFYQGFGSTLQNQVSHS